MVDFLLVAVQFLCLVLELFQLLGELHPLGGGGTGDALFQVRNGGAVAALLFVDVVGTDAGDGVRLVAVQIDEGLEAVFLAGVKRPVDGALLIDLAVVIKEVIQ